MYLKECKHITRIMRNTINISIMTNWGAKPIFNTAIFFNQQILEYNSLYKKIKDGSHWPN